MDDIEKKIGWSSKMDGLTEKGLQGFLSCKNIKELVTER